MLWFTAAARPNGISDNFDRADGGLGHGWVAMTDGRLSIASHAIVGTAGAEAGALRVTGSYGNDQYSQVEVTSQLSGREWIGPIVRSQHGGQDGYLGMYFWNSGDPELRIYKRVGGKWTQLGESYDSGPLPAGTQLRVTAVGSVVSLDEDGTERIAVADSTFTDGALGLMTYGAARADNWAGGKATASSPPALRIKYVSTDANGIASYDFTSGDDGNGTHVLRVLAPTHPKPGMPHNFLYVLPVEPELGTRWGDGLEVLRKLDAENDYNLTIIEPSFAKDPWYADNPKDPSTRYETFLTQDLVPWVTHHLAVTGHEQSWLIGFSKSGIGAADLILKHPDLFAAAAAWDFPANMTNYAAFQSSSADDYGTQANFKANYELTQSFVDAHKKPFLRRNRIWIGEGEVFPAGVAFYNALLTSTGIAHTTATPLRAPHRWDGGWVPLAVRALSQEAAALTANR
jgi:putative esterase